jgi:pyruvate dehydrogenase phosphatase
MEEEIAHLVSYFIAPPRNYRTPPYVTARPEVVSVSIASPTRHFPPSLSSLFSDTQEPSPSNQSAGTSPSKPNDLPTQTSSRRFIVLATDGLFDRLSSEQVVGLVGCWLDGTRGEKSSKEVLSNLSSSSFKPSTSTPILSSFSTGHKPKDGNSDDRRFVFEDVNLATHLIKNALGGPEREKVRALLSIPAPVSRRYRDDISVIVILLVSTNLSQKYVRLTTPSHVYRAIRAEPHLVRSRVFERWT